MKQTSRSRKGQKAELSRQAENLLRIERRKLRAAGESFGFKLGTSSLHIASKKIVGGNPREALKLLRYHSLVFGKLTETWNLLEMGRSLELELKSDETLFLEAVKELQKGRYSRVNSITGTCVGELEKKLKDFITVMYLDELRKKTQSLGRVSVDVRFLEELIEDAEILIETMDFETSLKLVCEAFFEMLEIAKELEKRILREVSYFSVDVFLSQVETSSSAISLKRARALVEKRQFGKVASIVRSVEAQRNRRLAGIVTANTIVVKKLLEIPLVPHDVREEVLSYMIRCEKEVLMGRLGNALGWIGKATRRAKNAEKQISRDLEDAVLQLEKNLVELENEGLQVKKIKDSVDESKSELGLGNTWRTARKVIKLRKLIDDVRTAHAGLSSCMTQALSVLANLEQAGHDISKIRSEIEMLRHHKDPEEALEHMILLSKRIGAIERGTAQNMKSRVEKFEARLNEVGFQSVESQQLKETIAEIRAQLERGYLGKVSDTLNQLEREFNIYEKACRDFKREADLLAETISKAKRGGIPIPPLAMTVVIDRRKSISEAKEFVVSMRGKVNSEIKKLRSSAKSRIQIVRNLLKENPDVDLSAPTESLSKAEAYLEEGRYREALETSFSAQEVAKEQLSLNQHLVSEVDRLKELIDGLPFSEGLRRDYDERLLVATSKGNYQTRINRMSSLEAEMIALEKELRERTESLSQKIEERIEEAEKEQIVLDSFVKGYHAAKESLVNRPIDEAVEILNSILLGLDELANAWTRAQETLRNFEGIIGLTQEAGLDTSKAELEVEEIKKGEDYKEIDRKVRNIQQKFTEELEELGKKALAKVEDVEALLDDMSSEIHVFAATATLSNARHLLEEGKFTKAIKQAEVARKTAQETEELYHMYREVFERGEGIVSGARDAGLEVSVLENVLAETSSETNYSSALESLEGIVSRTEKEIEEIQSKSFEEIQAIERDLEDLSKSDVPTSDIYSELEEAKRNHELGQFRLAFEKSGRARELITKRSTLITEVEEAMKGLQAVLKRADRFGVPMLDLEQRMEALLEVEDLHNRLDLIRELEKEARRNLGKSRVEAKMLLQQLVSSAESYPAVFPAYKQIHALIDNAASLLDEQKFGDAFDALRQTEAEIVRIEDTRLESLAEIEKNAFLLEDMEQSGIEVPDVSDNLLILSGYPDSGRVIEICSTISSELRSKKESRENELVERLRSLSQSLDDLRENDIDGAEVASFLKHGTKELREGHYQEAERYFELAEKKISDALILHRKLVEIAESLEELFKEMENAGLEIEEPRRDFDRYRQMLPYGIAIGTSVRLRSRCRKSLASLESEARALYDEFDGYVEQLRSQRICVDEIESLVIEAREMLGNRRYCDAIEGVRKARRAADGILDLFNQSREAIASARREIELSSVCGTDTEDLEQRLRIAEEGTDYEYATRIAREVSFESSRRRTEFESLVRSELDGVQDSINRMTQDGMTIDETVEGLLSQSRELLEEGKYSDSRDLIGQAGEISQELWNQYGEMLDTIEEAREQVKKIDDLIGERARGYIDRFTLSLSDLRWSTNYKAGRKAASDIQWEATEVWRGFETSLSKGLKELRSRLRDMSERNLDITMPEELLDKANQRLKEDLFGEGLDLLDKVSNEIERIERLRRTEEAIASTEEEFNKAEVLGVPVEDLRSEIPSAEEVLDFSVFSRKLDKLSELVQDRKENLRLTIEEDIQARQVEAQSMKTSGVFVESLEMIVEEAEGKLRDEEFIEARNLVEKFATEKENILRNHEELLEILEKARKKEDEATRARVDCADLKEAIECVWTIANYESSIKSLEEATLSTTAAIEESRARARSAIDEVRVFIERLENEGIQNLGVVRGELTLATSKWNDGRFEESFRIVQMAKEASEAAQKEHEALMAMMTRAEHSLGDAQTYIEEIQANGIVVSDALGLYKNAVSLFEEGRFEEAEEKAKEASELAKHVKETYEVAMERLGNLRDGVKKAESRGLDVSALMDGVNSLAQGHNYLELKLEVDRTHESLLSRIESRKEEIMQEISSQRGGIESLLEEKVVGARSALDLLEEAAQKLEEGFFAKATNLIEGAAEIGSKARKKRDERNQVLVDVEDLFSLVDKAGLKTGHFSKKLTSAKRIEEDVKAISKLRKLYRMMHAKLTERRGSVAKAIDEIRNRISELHRKIVDTSEVEHILSMAEARMKQGLLSDAEVVLQNAEDRISELADMIVEKRKAVDKAERALWEARKAGVDTGYLYVELEKSRLNPVLHESISGVKQVTRSANDGMRELNQGAEVLLNTVGARIMELEEKGIISRELELVNSSAREMTRVGNYGEAIKLCDKALAMAEETEKSFKKLREHMATAQHYLGEALRKHVEVGDLVERLGRSRSLDNYEQANEIVQEILAETEARFEEKGVRIVSTFEGPKEVIVDSAPLERIVGVPEDVSEVARVEVDEKGEIEEVTPLLEELLEEISISKEDAQRILSGLDRVVDQARSERVPVGDVARKLEKLSSSLDDPDFGKLVDELRMEIDDLRQKHLLDGCSCGAENPKGSRFCQVCGGVLAVDEIGPVLPTGIERICPRCSRLYGINSSYCQVCGIELEAIEAGLLEVTLTDVESRKQVRFSEFGERVFGRKDFIGWLSDRKVDYISRKHFKLSLKGRKVYLVHLSDTNPTKVNGEFVPKEEARELKKGDRIDIAEGVLVLEVDILP